MYMGVNTNNTEQKILDAALKIFSQKGYEATTTINIAESAGFSEKTLFRRFKTKKNLYNTVLLTNLEKLKLDMDKYVFVVRKFETPEDFLEYFIKNTAKLIWDNFEFFNLTTNERNEITEPMMAEITDFVGLYIEQNIPNQNIDYKIFGFDITTFIFRISLEKYVGRKYLNYNEYIEKFTKYCIQHINPKKLKKEGLNIN